MKSEILDIRTVLKPAGPGEATKVEVWYYGKLPDGRTLPCKLRRRGDLVEIFARELPKGQTESVEWVTQFSRSDWAFLSIVRKDQWETVCRLLLLARSHAEVRTKLEAFKQATLSNAGGGSL